MKTFVIKTTIQVMNDTSFDDIRPYYDREINAAMCRIADNP